MVMAMFAELHFAGVALAVDVHIHAAGGLGILQGLEDLFVDQREPRALLGGLSILRRRGELGLLRLAIDDEIERDFGVAAKAGRFGIGTEQIDRDRVRLVVMRQLGMVLVVAQLDEMAVVWSFRRMIVVCCATILRRMRRLTGSAGKRE